MSLEANKLVMRRYFEEIWNGRQLHLLDELIAPHYRNHASPEMPPGPEGLKPVFRAVLEVFPDISFSLDDVVAEGDRVVSRWTMRGTHSAVFMGVAATGKMLTNTGISIDRVTNGQIVEHWRVSNDLDVLKQLGVAP